MRRAWFHCPTAVLVPCDQAGEPDDDDDLLDFVAGPLSGQDVAVVQAAQALVEVGVRTLTTIARPLLACECHSVIN